MNTSVAMAERTPMSRTRAARTPNSADSCAGRPNSLTSTAPAAEKRVKPVGEWNEGRIVFRGNHAEHWLNGVKLLDTLEARTPRSAYTF